jgi:hypothetical protein
MFEQSTYDYWQLWNSYPENSLDLDDTRRIAIQLNLFALCVMHMAESGWSRELLEQKFQDCWHDGLNQGYTNLIRNVIQPGA